MTEVTWSEFERLRRRVEDSERRLTKQDTQFAVVNTKLNAILWALGAVGTAVIAAVVKLVLGVGV